MAACRDEISLLVLKNISLVRCAHLFAVLTCSLCFFLGIATKLDNKNNNTSKLFPN